MFGGIKIKILYCINDLFGPINIMTQNKIN